MSLANKTETIKVLALYIISEIGDRVLTEIEFSGPARVVMGMYIENRNIR